MTRRSNGPLSWLRVLDLTDLRGALCARLLADLGADVVRVERSDLPSATDGTTAHRYRNANKRGAAIDLSSQTGRDRLSSLLEETDVFIENLDLAERSRLGLTPDLTAHHQGLVHVSLADLGLSGPRALWRLEALPALAASGALHASGFPDLAPCNAPGYLAHDAASIYGALGALAGVLDRARHGAGQHVEISVQEAALAATVPWTIPMPDYLEIEPLLPIEGKRNADGSYWVLPTADGFIRTVTGTQRHWDGFVALLGSETLEAPEWQDRRFRLMNSDIVRVVAGEALTDRTRAQVFDEALGLTAVGMLLTTSEFVAHPQTRGRGYFISTGYPGLGDAPFARHPVNLSRTPASIRRRAPERGDDAAGFEISVAPDVATIGASEGLLLAGVRVIEVGVGQVVPELCGVLSELGADVIKIESIAHPDLLRGAGNGRLNCSFAFNTESRGRKSVALDLTTAEGRELAMALMAGADVVAENQRGGVMDGLGLGYDDVRARNAEVIYASSQGYGRGGPYGEMQAYGPLNTGFAGAHLLWNHPDAPYPCGTTLTYPDGTAGKILALSVLAALHHRAQTGEGQYIEMAQTEAVAYVLGEFYLQGALTGMDPAPLGNRHPAAAPHGVYPAAGDDEWIAIAVVDQTAWQGLCKAAGWGEEWSGRSLEQRLAAQDELDAHVSAWTRLQSPAGAAELLQGHGVSAMPVMGPIDQLSDDHLAQREFFVRLVHPEVGPERHAGNPIRMSRLEQRIAASAPCLGANTEEVLQSVLGLTGAEVADLRDRGVCR